MNSINLLYFQPNSDMAGRTVPGERENTAMPCFLVSSARHSVKRMTAVLLFTASGKDCNVGHKYSRPYLNLIFHTKNSREKVCKKIFWPVL